MYTVPGFGHKVRWGLFPHKNYLESHSIALVFVLFWERENSICFEREEKQLVFMIETLLREIRIKPLFYKMTKREFFLRSHTQKCEEPIIIHIN